MPVGIKDKMYSIAAISLLRREPCGERRFLLSGTFETVKKEKSAEQAIGMGTKFEKLVRSGEAHINYWGR